MMRIKKNEAQLNNVEIILKNSYTSFTEQPDIKFHDIPRIAFPLNDDM